MSEEQEQLAENASDSDLDSDSEDSEDEYCEITDSEEQEPVQANIPALQILIARSQKHNAFDRTFPSQRGPEPSVRTANTTWSSWLSLLNRYFHHCNRVIEAYGDGEVYETKEFAERVYKSHRQIVDKSKW